MDRKYASIVLISLMLTALAFFTIINPLTPKTGRKRVYVGIVADLFHYGHAELLQKAKAEGDYLIVGVLSDEEAAAYKRRPVMTLDERVQTVNNYSFINEVIVGAPHVISEQFIKDHNIDLIVHGDDHSPDQLDECFRIPIRMGKFKILPRTSDISTTDLIRRIKTRNDLQRKDKVIHMPNR